MIKVLYFGHQNDIGGGERSLLQLIGNLNQKEIMPIVIVSREGHFLDEIKKLNIKYYNLNLQEEFIKETAANAFEKGIIQKIILIKNLLSASKKLKKIIELEKPQIVHTNTLKSALITTIALFGTKIKHIYHDRTFTYNFVNKLIYRFASKIIVISEYVGSKYEKKDKLVRIYNGVESPEHYDGEINVKNRGGNLKIAFIGRLIPWKGPQLFVESALEILKFRKDVDFYLIGDDSIEKKEGFREQLIEKVMYSEYADKINFWGFKKDIYNIINQMDIIVVPSIEPEPFGRIVVEGMMMGKIVIASNIGGIPEIIKNGENGFLFEAGNATELTKGLKLIIDNYDKLRNVRKNAIRTYREKFTITNHVKNIELIYKEL
ncbi:glycosyltransferase [Geobacillus stearothermophilus]|nr:glycosyltransferase [Geobacillus stearothermophilus]WJQ10486.1 glycosyltransferase [Geobacillus stearothermophilus]